MAEDIVKRLPRSGSPIFLLFDVKRRYTIPKGVKYSGLEKNAVFDYENAFISEMIQLREAMAASAPWNVNRK